MEQIVWLPAGCGPATPPISWLLFTIVEVQAYNLRSKLPTQAHQLRFLASRTSSSDSITSYRKTSVLLKLINVTFAELKLKFILKY